MPTACAIAQREGLSMVLRSALASLVLLSFAPAFAADPAIHDLVDGRKVMAEDFLSRITDCVTRHDTDAAIFHGCADWTSAVKGYWALTAIARVTGDKELLATVLKDLSREGLAAERESLAGDPDFASPYGRAWLLKLAIEFEEATGDDRFTQIANDAATSLMRRFDGRRMDPLSSSAQSDTWPLLSLRAYGRYQDDEQMVAFVDEKVRPIHLWPCQFDADEVVGSSVAICTNWAQLVGESRGEAERKKAVRIVLPPDKPLKPVAHPGSEGVFGLNFSRAVGLWQLWQQTGDRSYLVAYGDHVRRGYQNRDWWGGSYQSVGHWVPQLGVLAILPLFEEHH
jgi:hypothetical protein